jgi:hypothetical protein
MRTVFVPYVIFPKDHVNKEREPTQPYSDSDSDEDEWERERKEAGNEESTVVLCVEIENSGESGTGFTVESVDIQVSGEGAKTTLIKWGCQEKEVFPLAIATGEQYNLLYAVAFLESPEISDPGSSNRKQPEMQRAVVININGRPHEDKGSNASYPTDTFSSRWNCILDLSANINKESVDIPPEDSSMKGDIHRDALPTPATPFPGPGPSTPRMRHSFPHTAHPQDTKSMIIASGSKQHTRASMPKSPVNYRSSIAMLNPALQQEKELYPSPLSHSAGFTPPSVMFHQQRAPTTYGPTSVSPPPLAPPFDLDVMSSPITPAYPAYPNSPAVPPPSASQTPMVNIQGSLGPSVDIRRGAGPRVFSANAGLRDSSGTVPTVSSGESDERSEGEPVVVSIGLLPLRKSRRRSDSSRTGEDTIYPNDKFTLDIFVFNKSSWIRRFEISYLDERSWRKRSGASVAGSKELGIIPLENRIRVG